jgi:integrase/recombinase XerD
MGKLRDQMLADLQLRGATTRTQEIYLREVSNLAKYFNRSPEELGEDELKEYMLYMMKERHLSDGTYRFYVAALKFFIQNDTETRMDGGEDQVSQEEKEAPDCSGLLGSGIPLFSHQKPQA